MNEYREVTGAYPGTILVRHHKTRLTRVLGADTVEDTTPFMLLEVMELDAGEDAEDGFPWHPYEGIESFLYFFDATRSGSHASVNSGSPGWVCSAMGDYKEEFPSFDGPVIGTQLWVWAGTNTPPSPLVSCPGRTALPEVRFGETTVRVIAGTFADQLGAVVLPQSKITYLDVYVGPKSEFMFQAFEEDPLLIYVLEGDGFFDQYEDELYPARRALTMSPGTTMRVKSTHRGLRFLLLHAPDAGSNVPVLDLSAVRTAESEWEKIVEDESK